MTYGEAQPLRLPAHYEGTTQHSLTAPGHDAGDTVTQKLFPVSTVNEALGGLGLFFESKGKSDYGCIILHSFNLTGWAVGGAEFCSAPGSGVPDLNASSKARTPGTQPFSANESLCENAGADPPGGHTAGKVIVIILGVHFGPDSETWDTPPQPPSVGSLGRGRTP